MPLFSLLFRSFPPIRLTKQSSLCALPPDLKAVWLFPAFRPHASGHAAT